MKKNIEIISLAILIAFSLIINGCGNAQTNKVNETIKIGVIVPLSDNQGVLGTYTLNGLQLAVKMQNSKGGLLGKEIILDAQDSKNEAKVGVSIIKNMLADKQKPEIFFSIMSSVTLAIKEETKKNNLILLAAVGSDKFLENSNYTIRNFVAATFVGQELSSYLRDSMKIHKLTIFYSNNEWGKSVNIAMSKFCTEKGITIEYSEPYEESSLEYKSLIAAKVNINTECVYVNGVGKGLGTLIKQLRESGYSGKIIGDPMITFPDVVNAAGNARNGIPYLDFAFDVNSKDTTTSAFVKAFRNEFKKDPQNFSAITYDGALMLFDAINKVGSMDSDKIIAQINSMSGYSGVFGKNTVENRNIKFSFVFKKS